MLTPEQRAELQRAFDAADGGPYEILALGRWVPQLLADLEAKDALIAELSARVAAQSELLSRKAEHPLFDRVVAALRNATEALGEEYANPSRAKFRWFAAEQAKRVLAEVDAAKGAMT